MIAGMQSSSVAEVPRRFAEPDGLELDRGGPRRRIEQFLLVPRQAARELIRGESPHLLLIGS